APRRKAASGTRGPVAPLKFVQNATPTRSLRQQAGGAVRKVGSVDVQQRTVGRMNRYRPVNGKRCHGCLPKLTLKGPGIDEENVRSPMHFGTSETTQGDRCAVIIFS